VILLQTGVVDNLGIIDDFFVSTERVKIRCSYNIIYTKHYIVINTYTQRERRKRQVTMRPIISILYYDQC